MQKNSDKNKTSLYQRIDDSLMRGANSAVKVWNWTTGCTKAEFANSVLGAGLALHITYGLLDHSKLPWSVFQTGLTSGLMFTNKMIEKDEKKAHESKALNERVEHAKDTLFKTGGQIFSLGSAITMATKPHDTSNELLGLGEVSWGVQFYIMRADYVPPQKSALSRGFDKLREQLRTSQLVPAPIPVPHDRPLRR
jgi:hypothetical protein